MKKISLICMLAIIPIKLCGACASPPVSPVSAFVITNAPKLGPIDHGDGKMSPLSLSPISPKVTRLASFKKLDNPNEVPKSSIFVFDYEKSLKKLAAIAIAIEEKENRQQEVAAAEPRRLGEE